MLRTLGHHQAPGHRTGSDGNHNRDAAHSPHQRWWEWYYDMQGGLFQLIQDLFYSNEHSLKETIKKIVPDYRLHPPSEMLISPNMSHVCKLVIYCKLLMALKSSFFFIQM